MRAAGMRVATAARAVYFAGVRTLWLSLFFTGCATTATDAPSAPGPLVTRTSASSAPAVETAETTVPIQSASPPSSASVGPSASAPASATLPTEAPRQALESGRAPADVADPPSDAQVLPSGVRIKVLRKGTGTVRPSAESVIRVHYAGWMRDGKLFDTSIKRDRPATFKISGIIPGWRHAMREMVAGDLARIWIPAELAFGDVPKRPGAPVGQLTFDVELIAVD